MNRTVFIIDGFNLYHSVREASENNGNITTKWLNIHSLCTSYLPLIGKDARLEGIYYFTAFAEHLASTGAVERHKCYIQCLEATGIKVELSRFKEKTIFCTLCKRNFIRHEEKETDVAVGAKLLELFFKDCCDTVVLVTGDTDLAPAVKTSRRLFPSKYVIFAFPYGRKSKQLSKLSHMSFKIKAQTYIKYQFSDPFPLLDGALVSKPISW
jgi:uncharacterized LabA/DUF88 family protein